MLKFKLNGEVLEVTEYQLSAKKTKVSYWYYNLKAWLKSRQGLKDESPSQTMTPEQIDWVRKNYVPKVAVDLQAIPELAKGLLS